MAEKKFYITTAIPYVNAAPHLGFALEIIQADVVARYHRLLGENVFFLAGTDENALKNVQAAEKEGISPKQLVDKYSARFKALKQALNLSFDDFIRTTEKRHFKGSQKFWKACQKDIYKKIYKGWYCVGCEEFKTKKDLINGTCPEHPNKNLELIEEENYFFRLSKYQKQLEKLIKKDKLKIVPLERKNEILQFIKTGLKDFSISRSFERAKGWGIPVPNDEQQIIYVWFDALINYVTALGYASNSKLFKKFWLENNNILHCIGKGIIRFHAVYWPAMLMSAGLPLPKEELIHGYVTINGQKISKSLGNVIDPFELVKKYGTDAVRYYLLKEIPSTKDGDFTIAHFEEVYNADLANGLGNLVQRVAVLAEKAGLKGFKKQKDIIDQIDIANFMDNFDFHQVLIYIWGYMSGLDRYINKERPWEKSGNDAIKILSKIIVADEGCRGILNIASLISPFLPETAQRIEEIFTAQRIEAPKKPLFPRLH